MYGMTLNLNHNDRYGIEKYAVKYEEMRLLKDFMDNFTGIENINQM